LTLRFSAAAKAWPRPAGVSRSHGFHQRHALARSLLGGLDGQEQAQLATLLGKLRASQRTA
jgi:hypothetical protein